MHFNLRCIRHPWDPLLFYGQREDINSDEPKTRSFGTYGHAGNMWTLLGNDCGDLPATSSVGPSLNAPSTVVETAADSVNSRHNSMFAVTAAGTPPELRQLADLWIRWRGQTLERKPYTGPDTVIAMIIIINTANKATLRVRGASWGALGNKSSKPKKNNL